MAVPPYIVPKLPVPDWSVPKAAALTHTGWLPACPVSAQAQACHDGENLYIRLEAQEQPIRATMSGVLDRVCEDSCLELFYAPVSGDPRYFNFEFNPLGAMDMSFGGARPNRVRQVPKKAAEWFQPRPFTTGGGWGLEFRIPLTFLRLYWPEFSFSGEGAGNFYKCGEQTAVPHFMAWSPLSCDTPDFHRRQDFGTLIFE